MHFQVIDPRSDSKRKENDLYLNQIPFDILEYIVHPKL